jgi:hypothetical protein
VWTGAPLLGIPAETYGNTTVKCEKFSVNGLLCVNMEIRLSPLYWTSYGLSSRDFIELRYRYFIVDHWQVLLKQGIAGFAIGLAAMVSHIEHWLVCLFGIMLLRFLDFLSTRFFMIIFYKFNSFKTDVLFVIYHTSLPSIKYLDEMET